jgi:hypothetical protein
LIIPKPGKPEKIRLIQNFSFPHCINSIFPNSSINSFIIANDFPTTWGKFSIVYNLIANLPPGSEVATRDVAEAYSTVPLHPSQWPAGVVCISDSLFCMDTCTAFRATPSAGIYGLIADAGVEIFQNNGIGPLDKWVDDHLFLRIKLEFLKQYNEYRRNWGLSFAHQGLRQSGSHLWFGEVCQDTKTLQESNENCLKPIQDLSNRSKRSKHDKLFSCNLQNINDLSNDLGIIWKPAKDQPFDTSTLYIGFLWDIELRIVYLSQEKVNKYLLAIHKWRKRSTHVLHIRKNSKSSES